MTSIPNSKIRYSPQYSNGFPEGSQNVYTYFGLAHRKGSSRRKSGNSNIWLWNSRWNSLNSRLGNSHSGNSTSLTKTHLHPRPEEFVMVTEKGTVGNIGSISRKCQEGRADSMSQIFQPNLSGKLLTHLSRLALTHPCFHQPTYPELTRCSACWREPKS